MKFKFKVQRYQADVADAVCATIMWRHTRAYLK